MREELRERFRATASETRVRQTDGVTFTTRDGLCLDGQKLDVVTGSHGAGDAEYRTELATFAKIVGKADTGCATCEHASFQVFHHNGHIASYSKHAGGSSLAYQRHGADPGTLTWVLTRLEDRAGNAIEYAWTKENATSAGQEQSMPRLTEVRYTTCTVAGDNTCPYGTAAQRKIVFEYEPRSDASVSYLAGARLDTKHRLKSVQVFGDLESSAIWTYKVSYQTSAFTGRSLVASVQQCAGSTCLPATSFSWQDAEKTTWYSTGLGMEANYVAPGQAGITGNEPNASEMSFALFDGNGDGFLDLVYKEWPSTAIDATTFQLKRTSNTLGVGPVDYLAMGRGGSGFDGATNIDLEGDGVPQASVRCTGSPTAAQLQGELSDLSSTVVIDLDQDGRQELFAPLNTGCPFQWTSTSGGVSTGARVTPLLRMTEPDAATTAQRVFQLLNLDRTTGKLTTRAAPVPFANKTTWDQWKYNFADLNGDGLADLYYGGTQLQNDAVLARLGRATVAPGAADAEAANPEVEYPSLSGTGEGYDTRLKFSWQRNASFIRTPNVLRVVDHDGDGRGEIRQMIYNGNEHWFSVDAKTQNAVRGFRDPGGEMTFDSQRLDATGLPGMLWVYPEGGRFAAGEMPWRNLDVNGDGLGDAMYARANSATSKYEWFYRLNTGLGYLPETAVGHVDVLDNYGKLAKPKVISGEMSMIQDIGLRFADMNGDGRDDLVLLDSTTGSIMYSTGAGFEAPINLPARASGSIERIKFAGNNLMWPASQIADVDGDGLPDVVEWVRDLARPSKRRLAILSHHLMPHGSYDVITDVTDGLSTTPAESVRYARLAGWHQSDATPRFNGATRTSPPCRYPARCVATGRAVLRYQSFRDARAADTRFDYAGARVDLQGRGWLGFRVISSRDVVSGTTTTQTFDQRRVDAGSSVHFYPAADTPATTTTEVTSLLVDATLIPLGTNDARTRTISTFTPSFNAEIPLRTTKIVTETVTSDLAAFSAAPSTEDRARHRVETTYNVYGDVKKTIETTSDAGALDAGVPNVTTVETTTTNYADTDPVRWLLGRPESSIKKMTTDDGACGTSDNCATVTQRWQYEYEDTARGLLRKAVREPNAKATKLTTVLERDNAGLVRRIRQKSDNGTERVSDVDFDANGLFPEASRDAAGHVTWQRYRPKYGLLDRTTDPNGIVVEVNYDKLGRLRRTRSNGTTTERSYDQADEGTDRVFAITETSNTGDASKTWFDGRGRPTLVLRPGFSPSGDPDTTTAVAYRYDAFGHVIHTSFAKLAQAWSSALTATPASLRTAHAAAAEVTSTARFDQVGRATTAIVGDPDKSGTTEGAGERTSYVYPKLGVMRVTDPAGNETTSFADARGLVRRITTARAGLTAVATSYSYTAHGKLIASQADNAPAETFVYDQLGRLQRWQLASTTQARTYTYTAFGEVERVAEPSVLDVKLTYDQLGRPLTRIDDLSGGVATERAIRFEWDTSPRQGDDTVLTVGLAKLTVDGGHETRFKYDSKARPYTISEVFKDGPTLTWGYRYDTVGRISQTVYPGAPQSLSGVTGGVPGVKVGYRYATNGQLRQILDETDATAVELWNVTERHPLGMLEAASNGPAATAPSSSAWDYHTNTLRPEQQTIATGTTSSLLQLTYRPDGALKTKAMGAFTETYTNAGLADRLTRYKRTGAGSSVDATFDYNNAGDITSLITATATAAPDWPAVGTRTFNNGAAGTVFSDLLVSITDAQQSLAYSYDAAGRQTERKLGTVRNRSIDSYNTFNLPTAVSLRDGATVLSTTSFAYDGVGARVSKQRGTERVLYVGKLFEAQSFRDQATGTDIKRSLSRIYAEGRPVAEILRDWTANAPRKTQYLYTDGQGSIVYRSDGTTSVPVDGTKAATAGFRGYHPYGKRWSLNNEKPAFSSIGFTGHLHDDDLGLIYMNARVYDPEQMRFISRDPLAMPFALGGTNPYAYVLGNPTNLTDPTGRQAVDGGTSGSCDDNPNGPGCDDPSCHEFGNLCTYIIGPPPPPTTTSLPQPPGPRELLDDGDPQPIEIYIAPPCDTKCQATRWKEKSEAEINATTPPPCGGHPPCAHTLTQVNGVDFGDAYTPPPAAAVAAPPRAPQPVPPGPSQASPAHAASPLDPSQYSFAQSSEVVRYIEANRDVFGNYADGLMNITHAMDGVRSGAMMRDEIWSSISSDVAVDGTFHPEHLRAAHIGAYEHSGYVPVPGDWLWDAGARFSGTWIGSYVGPWALETFPDAQAILQDVGGTNVQLRWSNDSPFNP